MSKKEKTIKDKIADLQSGMTAIEAEVHRDIVNRIDYRLAYNLIKKHGAYKIRQLLNINQYISGSDLYTCLEYGYDYQRTDVILRRDGIDKELKEIYKKREEEQALKVVYEETVPAGASVEPAEPEDDLGEVPF